MTFTFIKRLTGSHPVLQNWPYWRASAGLKELSCTDSWRLKGVRLLKG